MRGGTQRIATAVRTAGLLLLAVALAPMARAEDSAAGDAAASRAHALPGGGPVLRLPPGWRAATDEETLRVEARSPESDGQGWVRLRGEARPRHDGEDLDAWAARLEREARGESLLDDGFHVVDRHEATLAGAPARLVLVRRPRAAPPVASLHVLLAAGGGWHLRFDVPLGDYHARRSAILDLLFRIEPPSDAAPPDAAPPHIAPPDIAPPGDAPRVFAHRVPEAVAFRGHAFLRLVEQAAAKRTFGPEEDEAWTLAHDAWERTRDHARRLATDAQARRIDARLANLFTGPEALEAPYWIHEAFGPYLAVVPSARPLSRFDLSLEALDPAAFFEAEARRREALAQLASVRAVLEGLPARLLALLGDGHDLAPLASPWGGRPDLPPGTRRFEDGVTLAVIVHPDVDALERARGFPLPGRGVPPPWYEVERAATGDALHVVAGPGTGGADALRWRTHLARLAVRDLLAWFARQRRHWRPPPRATTPLEEGLVLWLAQNHLGPGDGGEDDAGAANAGGGRPALTWLALPTRLAEAKAREAHVPPRAVEALAHDLWAHLHAHREDGRFDRLLDLALSRPVGPLPFAHALRTDDDAGHAGPAALARALGARVEEDPFSSAATITLKLNADGRIEIDVQEERRRSQIFLPALPTGDAAIRDLVRASLEARLATLLAEHRAPRGGVPPRWVMAFEDDARPEDRALVLGVLRRLDPPGWNEGAATR